jgi:hypothetical protein
VSVRDSEPTTVWFAVGGSDRSAAEAHAAVDAALADPRGLLAEKIASRTAAGANTVVDLPGDRLLQRSVEWSKQNLLDSVQEAHDLDLRVTNAGVNFPPPDGTLDRARWLGAGWPDYPWLFGTDGEYTAFASVAMGQFDDIKAHLRALRDVSEIVNDGSGKVVHEVTPDGAVYFGANEDPGNTDETAKFPSAVALIWRWTGDDAFRDDLYDFTVRNMRYIVEQLDEDGDGWPEGLGNVERPGMGEERLDNTVYTIRGLRDLADMRTRSGTVPLRTGRPAWSATSSSASSRRGGSAATPASTRTRCRTPKTPRSSSVTGSASRRWTPCWSVPASCRAHWRIQLDPSIWEQPGAMPEIAPAGDFTPNIDRLFTERSMVLQAWGAYGTLWPVVHHQLGVSPDLGRATVKVAPQIPEGQHRIAGSNIRLGDGAIDVEATRRRDQLTTTVNLRVDAALTIGHVLPPGASVHAVHLDGQRVDHDIVDTARGREVLVEAGAALGRHSLRITLQ